MSAKPLITFTLLMAALIALPLSAGTAGNTSLKGLIGRYHQDATPEQRRETIRQMMTIKPTSVDDVSELHGIFSAKTWDEDLFQGAMAVVSKADKPEMDAELVAILVEQQRHVEAANQGRSDRETMLRDQSAGVIIGRLGSLKSKRAVPAIKEYLAFKSTQLIASQALAAIGDRSASEDIRQRAYRGESVDYAGLGSEEATRVVQDLEDKGNRDKWEKIAPQLAWVKDAGVKPRLKGLFRHESTFVRMQASVAFSRLCTAEDTAGVLEMIKNPDFGVRDAGVDCMKKTSAKEYDAALVSLLESDPNHVVRLSAAKAIGYKKLTRAIPNLERALNDKDRRVREESFIALFLLTGKKYDYAGKTPLMDHRAEQQKAHPSFY